MSGAGITYGRPRSKKIREVTFLHTRAGSKIDADNMTCSAFRSDDEIDPVNELICFETGIKLPNDTTYRLKFVNSPSLLRAGYQVLDVFEPSGEHIYMIKVRDSTDISSPFPVPFVLEKILDGGNFSIAVKGHTEQYQPREPEFVSKAVYAPRNHSRWG